MADYDYEMQFHNHDGQEEPYEGAEGHAAFQMLMNEAFSRAEEIASLPEVQQNDATFNFIQEMKDKYGDLVPENAIEGQIMDAINSMKVQH